MLVDTNPDEPENYYELKATAAPGNRLYLMNQILILQAAPAAAESTTVTTVQDDEGEADPPEPFEYTDWGMEE